MFEHKICSQNFDKQQKQLKQIKIIEVYIIQK